MSTLINISSNPKTCLSRLLALALLVMLSAQAGAVDLIWGKRTCSNWGNSWAATVTLNLVGAITMTAEKYECFPTFTAPGPDDWITLTTALTDAATLNAAIETFVLAAGTNSVTSGADGQIINADALTDAQVLTLAGTHNVTVTLTGGDLISTSSGNITVIATTGSNVITTGAGADTITGGAGADTINSGDGNDIIIIAASSDDASGESYSGGAGTDTLRITGTTTVDLSDDAIATIENLDLSTSNALQTVTLTAAQLNSFSGGITANEWDVLNIKTLKNAAVTGTAATDNFVVLNTDTEVTIHNFKTKGFDIVQLGGSNVAVAVNTGDFGNDLPFRIIFDTAAHMKGGVITVDSSGNVWPIHWAVASDTGDIYYDADAYWYAGAVKVGTVGVVPGLAATDFRIGTTTAAPAALSSTSYDGKTSNAGFGVGITRISSTGYSDEANSGETVRIVGIVRPELQHIGQRANIYVVDWFNQTYIMLTQDGGYKPWNFQVAFLQPFLVNVTLSENMELVLFTGKLGIIGIHSLYIGYAPADGVLRYTPVPQRLIISQ